MTSPILLVSHAAVVSDNDGSAFITKAEFDSLKNNFQAQIDNYNQSIDSKIDGAIAAYLAGIKIETGENHLDIEWIAEFGDTTMGILDCKCVDILQEKIKSVSGKKGSIWAWTYERDTSVLGLRSIWLQASSSISLADSVYQTTPTALDYSKCQYIFQPQFENSNTYFSRLIQQTASGYYYQERSTTSLPGGYVHAARSFDGVACRTYYENSTYTKSIGETYSVLDEVWTDKAGFPVYAYKVGDLNKTDQNQSVLGYPLIKAVDGQGEIKFMYNTRDDHPFKSSYGCYSTNGGYNSGAKGDNAKVYIAITDLTTGTIEEYLTPQDGNIIRDYINQEDGVWKIVTGNIRANQALMLYMRSDVIGNAYADNLYAFRIKMNFQNLNP